MDTPDPTTTMDPPPPPPFVQRRLRRRPAEGSIGGVCAGLADYLAVDPTVVRLAAVLLAVLGPGIPAYLIAWLVIPEVGPSDRRSTPPGQLGLAVGERAPQFVGAALLVIAAVVVWDRLDWPGDGFVLPLLLIGAGVALLARSAPPADDGASIDAVTATAPAPEPSQSWRDPGTGSTWVTPEPPEPAPRRRRSRVGAAVVGAALLWGGIAVLADVAIETGLAVAAGILGAGLVVGAFVGGARSLIVPGILVTAALLGTAAVDVPFSGGIGDRDWVVSDRDDAAEPFRLAVGEGRLDLRALRPGEERTVEVVATVAIGHLVVRVPEGVPLELRASADAGAVVVLGDDEVGGADVDVDLTEPDRVGVGTLVLDVGVGLGQVEVIR